MNDPQDASAARLASALLAATPDTLPEALSGLFDAYADGLFGYCWLMLRNTDLAQIALRDTLVVAQAHIGLLAETGNLDSWLYSLARAECRRRRPVPPGAADEPPARPSQPDADSRLMAWNAVTSMDAEAMEVLDLACRRDVDLGLVLGLPGHEARGLLDAARPELEQALGAEILVSRAGHACPDRADVMRGWTGMMTPELRERVLRHAAGCRVCGPSLPRNVSATRVFALLPVPSLPAGTRERVLGFFADPRMSAYREFAVTRVAGFGPDGFPSGADTAPRRPAGTLPLGLDDARPRDDAGPRDRGRTHTVPSSRRTLTLPPRARVLAVAGAATVAAAVAAAFVLGAQGNQIRSLGQGPATSSGGGPVVPRRAGAGAGAEGAVPIGSPTAVIRSRPHARASASELLFAKVTQPLVSPTRGNPPVSPPRLPRRPLPPRPASTAQPKTQSPAPGTLQVSPGALNLGTSSQAILTITADGATQTWSASTSSVQLVLGASGGTLRAGQSVALTVGVARNNSTGGSALIYIDRGSASAQTVQVSWTGASSGTGHQRPPTPAPSPTPSPAPSSSPSSSPSPSPSPSAASGSSPPSPYNSPPPHHHPSPSQSPSPTPSPSPSATPIPSTGPDATGSS